MKYTIRNIQTQVQLSAELIQTHIKPLKCMLVRHSSVALTISLYY